MMPKKLASFVRVSTNDASAGGVEGHAKPYSGWRLMTALMVVRAYPMYRVNRTAEMARSAGIESGPADVSFERRM